MAADCAMELRKHQVSFISLWPGYVKTEIFVEAAQKTPNAMTVSKLLELTSMLVFQQFNQIIV